jgi:hypothetical protein
MEARDVVVLGWWAREQDRIDFVALLRRELGLDLFEAKKLFEGQLSSGKLLVIPVQPAERAASVAREIEGLGGEVRLLSGHAKASDAAARELEKLQRELTAFLATPESRRRETGGAASRICPELRVRSERERPN